MPDSAFLKLLLNPAFTGRMLRRMGTAGKEMEPLFRHTANATIINGGEKANVIPSEVTVNLDCRMLPGYDSEDLLGELQAIAGPDIEFRAVNFQPKPWILNMGLFDTLADIISEQDPEGVSVPMLMPAGTDGRHFARLGIQTYGWMPMNLPADFDFLKTIHAANERVPVSALEFGAEALYRPVAAVSRMTVRFAATAPLLLMVVGLLACAPDQSPVAADVPIPATAGLLRLADNLDDPQGYCVDVAGFGANIRLDAPLQAHTCKPGSDDQMFAPIAPADGGGIRLVEYERCLAAAMAESGAEINVVGCDAGVVNQRFNLDSNGRVQLALPDGPGLCLGIAAGQGEQAGGRDHLRRDLLLYDCDSADSALITWELAEQQ